MIDRNITIYYDHNFTECRTHSRIALPWCNKFIFHNVIDSLFVVFFACFMHKLRLTSERNTSALSFLPTPPIKLRQNKKCTCIARLLILGVRAFFVDVYIFFFFIFFLQIISFLQFSIIIITINLPEIIAPTNAIEQKWSKRMHMSDR